MNASARRIATLPPQSSVTRFGRAHRILAWAALALPLVVAHAASQPCTGCNATGVWTQPSDPGADWGYPQIHLALLRGGVVNSVAHHSYLISWAETGPGTNASKLHAWNPGDPDYDTYPVTYLQHLGAPYTDISTDVDLFCAGHSTLGDGRLLVSGGHKGHDIGIVDARIFDPATRTWSTPSDTMHYARWYPTNTTLPSGAEVLTTSGSRFYKSLTFGGSSNLDDAAASINDLRPGQLGFPNIVWESATAKPSPWPDPREGHTAAWLGAYNRMVVFGGRGTDGAYLKDAWLLEYGQVGAESYAVSGQQVADGPEERYGHVATANWDGTFMLVHGGKNLAGAVSNEVHRFSLGGIGSPWSAALSQTGPAPGARWGHAAAWDDLNQRVIVFGGRNQSGLANEKVYTLAVSGDPPTATWQEITPTGGSGLTLREGHSLVWDNEEHSRAGMGSGWQRVILFGGQDAGGLKNDAWILWYNKATLNQMAWEQVPAGPAPPPARTRHAAFWDFGRRRMVVVGGDTGGATSADDLWELKISASGPPSLEWATAPGHMPGLAGQTVVRVSSELAARPERFNSATGQYSDAFDALVQPFYPAMFVLPNGNLLYPATNTWTKILNTTNGQWTNIAPLNGGDDDFYGEAAATYRPGKVIKAGTDSPLPGISLPNRTAKLEFDASGQTPGWVTGEPMSGAARSDHNLTILPNGKVLVTGGGNDYPEIWDPDAIATNWWSGYGVLAPNPVTRAYHSTIVLLPDGRLASAGGISLPNDGAQKVTIFSPPYLFDAQGNFAPRPGILDAPCTIAYGASNTFEVRTSDIAGMQAGGTVALIRPGAVTHGFDQNQRYVPLSFTMCGDRLRVQAPANANLAPPGDYLLFLVNASGVPSVARWMRVGSSPLANCDGAIPSAANEPVPEIISETEVWMYWNGAADDAPSSGTVAAYDVRRSAQTISDEAAFCTSVSDGEPSPTSPLEPPGGYQWWYVDGLDPNTLYHFALKARDESWNWAPVSASASARTLSSWGGGGGYSARRVGGEDMLRSGAADGESRHNSRVDASSARRIADGGIQGTGSLSSEPMSLVSRAGEPLSVEMRLESGRPIWTIHHLDAAAATELTGTDGATIIFQVPGADGAWQTRARLHPEVGSARFGLRSAHRTRRFIFLRQVGLDLAAQAVEAAGGGVWKLAEARHSHLGDVTPAVQAAGGYDLGLLSDEALTLTYEPGSAGNDPVTDCFVFVSPNGTSTGLANRGRSRLGDQAKLPTSFALYQNQPNPFGRSTTIRFDLATECDVRLALFDAQGRRVRMLAAGRRPAGFHALEWDRRDDAGREVQAGVYLYRLEAGAFRAQRKVVLLP